MAGWSHHWAGFGDLFDDLGSRELAEVLRHVDPIYQPARFNHTVLMLRAGNDEASVPDATYDFYEKMNRNQKIYLRSLPNSLHEIDERFRNTIEGFYVAERSKNKESPLPNLNWTLVATDEQNEIVVSSDRRPSRVTVWMSETQNRNKKDFRLLKLDKDGVTAQNSQYLPFKEPPHLEDISFDFSRFRLLEGVLHRARVRRALGVADLHDGDERDSGAAALARLLAIPAQETLLRLREEVRAALFVIYRNHNHNQ